jgi:hypothetical protein
MGEFPVVRWEFDGAGKLHVLTYGKRSGKQRSTVVEGGLWQRGFSLRKRGGYLSNFPPSRRGKSRKISILTMITWKVPPGHFGPCRAFLSGFNRAPFSFSLPEASENTKSTASKIAQILAGKDGEAQRCHLSCWLDNEAFVSKKS